jgi:hypothetical protein
MSAADGASTERESAVSTSNTPPTPDNIQALGERLRSEHGTPTPLPVEDSDDRLLGEVEQ